MKFIYGDKEILAVPHGIEDEMWIDKIQTGSIIETSDEGGRKEYHKVVDRIVCLKVVRTKPPKPA